MSEGERDPEGEWDTVLKPHLSPYFAYGAAFVIAAAHIAVGALLRIAPSGVTFATSDQVGIALVGLIVAGGVLLFARPRVRAGASGIEVRNVLGTKMFPWAQIIGVSFPPGARWAHLELPDDEYEPLMAIQAVDKERAVAAMEAIRAVMQEYHG